MMKTHHPQRIKAATLRTTPNQLKARSVLITIDRERLALELLESGHTQVQIASTLGISQATVHRITTRRTHVEHAREDPSPREIIARAANDDITREQMMDDLLARSYDSGHIPEGSYDAYVPGTWDQIREAHLDELITDEEYERLKDHHYGRGHVSR